MHALINSIIDKMKFDIIMLLHDNILYRAKFISKIYFSKNVTDILRIALRK